MRTLAFALMLFLLANNLSASDKTVYIGAVYDDWPPYQYAERKGGAKTGRMIGSNIDLLNKIFPQQGFRFKIVHYPWKRILLNLKNGGDEVQVSLPTSINKIRRESYLVSDSVYTVRPSFYYLKKNYPQGLEISEPSELLEHGPVCGQLGYNYANFGINSSDVSDTGAISLRSLFKKLEWQRCKIILARYEVVAAQYLTGKALIHDEIGHGFMPVAKEEFSFLISKSYPHAEELVQTINNGLEQHRRPERLDEMATHPLPE